jgi:diaminopimelate epimerase
LVAAFKGFVKSPVSIKTSGGEILTVHFEIESDQIKKVFFEGDVHIAYEGEMWEEAYE